MKWTLISLCAILISNPVNAQVTPADTFQVIERGDSVTATAAVISIEGARGRAKLIDSLRAALDTSESTIASQDSLINNLDRQLELCATSRARKDTLLRYERGVKKTQTEVIEALRENQPSFFEELYSHSQSFVVGYGTCAVVGQISN